MGVAKFDLEYDNMLRNHCEGVNGRTRGNCLTVQPALFDHHRPGYVSSHSDIANHEQGVVEKPSMDGIRWSTRVNLWKLIMREYHDFYTSRCRLLTAR